MAKHGKMAWFPAVVIDELEDIKREDDISDHSEAVKKLVKYARVGRETKRLATFDFSKSIPRIPIDDFQYKKKRVRGMF
jgi:hypothetical protein